MQFLQAIKTVLTLLPLIIEAVRAVEAAMPGSGQGASKLALIRQAVQATYDLVADATPQFEAVWPALEKTIAAVVATFNALGEFKK